MTERPILFQGPMVRAIQAGVKTQTRRIIKPYRGFERHSICAPSMAAADHQVWFHYPDTERVGHMVSCPHGVPGDRLWVREGWRVCGWPENSPIRIELKADGERHYAAGPISSADAYEDWYERIAVESTNAVAAAAKRGADGVFYDEIEGIWTWHTGKNPLRWRPSIHMPRWASRITLEVVSIRAERLQDITEEDALAEGIVLIPRSLTANGRLDGYGVPGTPPDEAQTTRVFAFAALWDSINGSTGPESWAANPWVWREEFRLVADAAGRVG